MHGRHSRRRRDVQQFLFDDYTKCKGLTQKELDEDLKLMQLAAYTAPSTKYKIRNPISKKKRQIISSLYDQKNVGVDLAKQNNQLLRELSGLKKQNEATKHQIIQNQCQIAMCSLNTQIIQRQFELNQQIKIRQIECLNKYRNECREAMALKQSELEHLLSDCSNTATSNDALLNALHYIKNLKNELKTQRDIVSVFEKKEESDSNLIKMNERFEKIFEETKQQRKEINRLESVNKRILNKLQQSNAAYDALMKVHKQASNELSRLKFSSNNKMKEMNQRCVDYERKVSLLKSECNKYRQCALLFASQQTKNQYLNGCVSLDYYQQVLINDGLKKGNKIFEAKYNALNKELNALKSEKQTKSLSHYQLESVIIEQNNQQNALSKSLHAEKQKYFERIIQFKDDLELLYKKTEGTIYENNKMKQDANKKTFVLQRENDKLRATLKQSHSNLRVKQTEIEQEQQQNTIDLEQRCNVLKNAINDLNFALNDAHVQMLSFQKQVFDEMDCSKPSDEQLLIHKEPQQAQKKVAALAALYEPVKKKVSTAAHKSRKRPRDDLLEKQNIPSTPTSKRRKKSSAHNSEKRRHQQQQHSFAEIDSSSSSEISHSSTHQNESDFYKFDAPLNDSFENADDHRTFYSILTNTKHETYILANEYIKITRRGHPDYIGRVESMFFDKKAKKKKVCVSIFHLASDIPDINECVVANGQTIGKREYVELILSKKHKQFKSQKESTKIFGVGRIQRNKKVTLWFPKNHMTIKKIEKLTSGRDVFFCRYRYDKNTKKLTKINGTDDGPISDYQ